MRRYVLAGYLEQEPDAATTEIVALTLAATAAVPVHAAEGLSSACWATVTPSALAMSHSRARLVER